MEKVTKKHQHITWANVYCERRRLNGGKQRHKAAMICRWIPAKDDEDDHGKQEEYDGILIIPAYGGIARSHYTRGT